MKVTHSEQENIPPEQPATNTDDGSLDRLGRERGIGTSVLSAAGIDVDTGDHNGWWRIPYPHRGGTWKYRYRNPDNEGRPKYLDDPGAAPHLYNPALIGPGEEEVWFCEGEFDTLALLDQGLTAVGIHGTSNVPDEKDGETEYSGRFPKAWSYLFDDTLCLIAFDNDDSGNRAGRKLARALEGEVFDQWNRDYTDINEWHKADPQGLKITLQNFRAKVRTSRGYT
jgi:hypothetical protein